MKLSTAKKIWIKLSVLVVLLAGAAVEMKTAQAALPGPSTCAGRCSLMYIGCVLSGGSPAVCQAEERACAANCPPPQL